MIIHGSYFALSPALNPLYLVDRWRNPKRHQHVVNLRGHPLAVRWTERAHRALGRRRSPLMVEMQLYFSCVIKKRVLFHDQPDVNATPVNDKLVVVFRPVESTSCDPIEFARHYPVRREFDSRAARKMHPRWLTFDYTNGSFFGEFGLTDSEKGS